MKENIILSAIIFVANFGTCYIGYKSKLSKKRIALVLFCVDLAVVAIWYIALTISLCVN